jgi:hypothetical protein
MLIEADEVCGSRFFEDYIPRYSADIHLLRRDGFVTSKRPCDRHRHAGTAWLYTLDATRADFSEPRRLFVVEEVGR